MNTQVPQRREESTDDMSDALRRMRDANEIAQAEIAAWLNPDGAGEIEHTLLRTLIDKLPDYLFVKDTKSRFVIANQTLATDHGLAHPSDLIGKTDFDIHPPESAQQFWNCERAIFESGEPVIDIEERIVDVRGKVKWLSTTKLPLRNTRGTIIGLAGVARDMTDRKKEELIRLGQARILEMVASSASLDSVLQELTVFVESQLDKILASILLLDTRTQQLYHGSAPSLPDSYRRAIEGARIGPDVGSCGTAAYCKQTVIVPDITTDDKWRDYRDLAMAHGLRSCWSTPIISHQGDVLGTFALYSREVRTPDLLEISLIETASRLAGIAIERQEAQFRIEHMAHHDALTGLPNRSLLLERLEDALDRAKSDGHGVTLAFIDLDNLKLINDTLGHSTGDKVLSVLAERMSECVRGTDTVARLGGDEFVVLFADHTPVRGAMMAKVEALQRTLSEPIFIDGQLRQVTASIGLASFPDDGRDPQTLLMNADSAMYQAKERGRNNCQTFDAQFNIAAQERLALQDGLRQALLREEFTLVYQPQVELASGRTFAVEALIRWQHPTLGLVPPAKFIPVAEESGLIVPIGDWVLRTACAQNRAWQAAGAQPVVISVNVSARQFAERNWVHRVNAALEETGLDPSYLELELTESLIIQDVALAIATMRQLRVMGVQLSIDDFGMGYSSLNALKSFPVARLKLDQSFVREIPNNRSDNAIAIAIISLGHQLNLKVIAEGVENASQLRFLREHHCDEAQGYYFSKPRPASEIETLLKQA